MPTITVSRKFEHAPEKVFDAWLDPATAGQWLFATPEGRMTKVEIDPRVGGGFTIVREGDIDAEHLGEYLELGRPRRLVFTFWVEPYSAGQKTRVEIDFAPLAEGCELILTHEDVPEEWAERTQQGWGMILENLAKSLAS